MPLQCIQSFLTVFCPIIIMGGTLIITGCAFKNPSDPFEGVNRGVFVINKTLDRALLRPASRIYQTVIPPFFQTRINNFFQNLSEIPSAANDLLQGDLKNFGNDASRFILNSTWGLGGLFDVAATSGRIRHCNDFGKTLGKWGYRDSIYIVLPFLGPSTVRDGIGRLVNYAVSPWPYIRPTSLGWGLYAAYAIDARAYYIKFEPAFDEACVDEYVFIRDAYLQKRCADIKGTSDTIEPVLLEGPPE